MSAHDRLRVHLHLRAKVALGQGAHRNFRQAVQTVANHGRNRIPASTIPRGARRGALHPSATRIRKLTDASSRKSMLSAKSDTDPIATATGTQLSTRLN